MILQAKINEHLSQQDVSEAAVVSPNDALGKVLGKEHSGRVRGLGFGTCPSSAFGYATRRRYYNSSGSNSQLQEEVNTLKSQLSTLQNFLRDYIQEKEGIVPSALHSVFGVSPQV